MAEVLELVAGGIAIYQGAEALVKLAVSLRRLWKEIQDVPTTIQDTLTELERVTILLETVKAALMPTASECVGGGSAIPSIQSLAIAECHRVQRGLEALVTDLASDIASKRGLKKRVAQTRVVLKKDELEKHDRRLQRAVGFLNSTIQLFLAASIKQQPALIAREMAHALGPSIQQQSMVVATEVASILATQQGRSNLVSNSDRPAEEGDVVHGQIVGASDCRSSNSGSQTSATRRRVKIPKLHSILHRLGIDLLEAEEQNSLSAPRTKSYYIGINPLKKLLNKAWDLQISAACSGWNFGFRTYAVIADFFDMPWLEEKVDSSLYRPANVQFLRTLHEGTLEELFKLFRDGLATPFLKDQHGNTLLHWLVLYRCHWVKPLLDAYFKPSDLLIQNDSGGTPLEIYMWDPLESWAELANDDIAVHRYFLLHDLYEYTRTEACFGSEEDLFESVQSKPDRRFLTVTVMTRSVEHFESMRETYFADFYQWPLENRALLATQHFMKADPKALSLFYSDTPDFRSLDIRTPVVCRELSDTPLPLYYYIFQCWGGILSRKFIKFYDYPFSPRSSDRTVRSLMSAVLSILETSELSKPITFAGSTILVHALWNSSSCKRHNGCSVPHCTSCFYHPARRALRDSDMAHQKASKDAMKEEFHRFLEGAKAAGHDLMVYGQAEKRMTEAHVPPLDEWFKESRLQDGTSYCRVVRRRFTGLKYGPNPEDWDLEFEIFPEDQDKPWRDSSEIGPDYVWVEELREPTDWNDGSQEDLPRIPGAWVDDDGEEVEKSTKDEEGMEDEESTGAEDDQDDEGSDRPKEDNDVQEEGELDLEEVEREVERAWQEFEKCREERMKQEQRLRELSASIERMDAALERVDAARRYWMLSMKEAYTEFHRLKVGKDREEEE